MLRVCCRGSPADPTTTADVANIMEHPFAESWDAYARGSNRIPGVWPGDEWGDPALWQAWFERLFVPAGVQEWSRAIEIGQGGGKYTAKVLASGCREVLACDVAAQFIDVCRERFPTEVAQGRLHLRQIDEGDPYALQTACRELQWHGQADAVYSIDTLVHVEFTAVAAYLLAATELLRPGGHFLMTFADGSSAAGFHKLVLDIDRVVHDHGHPRTGCFRWVTPELVRITSERMGFEVLLCDLDPVHQRDGHLLARFADPKTAAAVRAMRQQDA
jgi:SAM-dependent methyltransferase